MRQMQNVNIHLTKCKHSPNPLTKKSRYAIITIKQRWLASTNKLLTEIIKEAEKMTMIKRIYVCKNGIFKNRLFGDVFPPQSAF